MRAAPMPALISFAFSSLQGLRLQMLKFHLHLQAVEAEVQIQAMFDIQMRIDWLQ
jgi:hypothetical protein